MCLWLECREDDGGNDEPQPLTATPMPVECHFPMLTTLFIDGRNYYNACSRGGAGWTDVVGKVESLMVSCYRPRSGEYLSSNAFVLPLTTLDDLRNLQIIDIDLSSVIEQPAPVNVEPLLLNPLQYFRLWDLADSHAVAELLDMTTSVSDLDIACSAIPLRMNGFGSENRLELDRIDEKDLIPLLCAWEGESPVVTKCPGSNDVIPEMMCVQEDGEYICAMNMACFEIVDCPNVFVGAPKRLVNTLRHPNAEPRREVIKVYGLVPHFSEEEKSWFETNVEHFDNWWCP